MKIEEKNPVAIGAAVGCAGVVVAALVAAKRFEKWRMPCLAGAGAAGGGCAVALAFRMRPLAPLAEPMVFDEAECQGKQQTLQCGFRYATFTYEGAPVVFKASSAGCKEAAKRRLHFGQVARALIQKRGWDKLYVPRCSLIERDNFCTLVEEKLPIPSTPKVEQTWAEECANPSADFRELVGQLRDFVLETDWDDVDFRNLPMVDGRLMLIDLEEPSESRVAGRGILGSINNSRGLIRCLSPEMGQELVRTLPAHLQEVGQRKVEERREELERVAAVEQFHRERKITVESRLPELGGDAEVMAKQINEQLGRANRELPLHRQRLVEINIHGETVVQVLKELQNASHIHSFKTSFAPTYVIQA